MTQHGAESARRDAIVSAARDCFIRFGYAKTSFVDIAKAAGISRPLIYLHFKSKPELMSAVFTALFIERYPRVDAVLAAPGTTREKLMRVYEILFVEPWAEHERSGMLADFYATCEAIIPEAEAAYQKRRLRYTQDLLGNRETALVFSLAVDGLAIDLPSAASLRKRIRILVERFT